MENKGKFIVLEGGEGAGKSTMIKLAAEKFGDRLLITREPGGCPFAEEIRFLMRNHPLSGEADANTQFGLIWASRAAHLKDTVRPALESGKNVLTDRFDSSTWAYQVCGQDGKHLRDLFLDIQKVFVGETKPDLYIFLDVDPEEGMKRKFLARQEEEPNHFDKQSLAFHNRVREGYKEFLQKVPSVVIDANQPLEKVKEEFLRNLEKVLNT